MHGVTKTKEPFTDLVFAPIWASESIRTCTVLSGQEYSPSRERHVFQKCCSSAHMRETSSERAIDLEKYELAHDKERESETLAELQAEEEGSRVCRSLQDGGFNTNVCISPTTPKLRLLGLQLPDRFFPKVQPRRWRDCRSTAETTNFSCWLRGQPPSSAKNDPSWFWARYFWCFSLIYRRFLPGQRSFIH